MGKNTAIHSPVTVGNPIVQEVDEFTYLGKKVRKDGRKGREQEDWKGQQGVCYVTLNLEIEEEQSVNQTQDF